MELRIKEQYINDAIKCPLVNKYVPLMFTDPNNWQYYCSIGYSFVFEYIDEKENKEE